MLRGSRLRRKLARTLEGESGMNDPVALLLVVGFIDWIEMPDYGLVDMAGTLAVKLAIGLVVGLADRLRRAVVVSQPRICRARGCTRSRRSPPRRSPTALTEVGHGSGFLAVYIAALILGTGPVPAKQTTIAFHQGLSWVSQISLFALLGLLVFPSGLGDVAAEGLLLSAALIFVARPVATAIASAFSPFDVREKVMLSWAGLRGAIPIWLATFPVIAGVEGSSEIFNAIFFVVVSSTLIQGATFEPLARRLGVTSTTSALPQPLIETGIIRRLGGESLIWRINDGDAAAGHTVKELGLPREALVNLIVRRGTAIPPRGSTALEVGDELHIVVRLEQLPQVERLTDRWRDGPVGEAPASQLPPRGAPQVFTVRPWRRGRRRSGRAARRSTASPSSHGCAPAATTPARSSASPTDATPSPATSSSRSAAAASSPTGARAAPREPGLEPVDSAWWQELAGALAAPSPRRR